MCFKGSSIGYSYILNHIMKIVRKAFITEESDWFFTLQGWMLLIYLNRLGILTDNCEKDRPMDQTFFQSFKITSKEEFEG